MASDPSVDARHMARALELAERGWGRVHPNPMVGAVVARDGEIIGEGWHAAFGAEHAEVAALTAAGARSRGATLYSTLEPCTHHGKQPPCTEAIIAAGINRVVVALRDPNPAAAGGVAALLAAGIVVDLGVREHDAAHQNFRFLRAFATRSRPFVAVKLAVSMDGQIADATGDSRWLSGPSARRWVHRVRAGFGAIGVGGITAVNDRTRLTVRGAMEPRVAPTRVVFDRGGLVTADHPLFDAVGEVPVIVVHGVDVEPARATELTAAGATVLVAEGLEHALAQVAAAGSDSLLIEGGGRLAGALLRDGLVDRVYQLQCPLWLGDGVDAWTGLGMRRIGNAVRWHVVHQELIGDDGDVLIELEP